MIGAQAILNRFARAVATYERQAVVQRLVAERLTELLGRHLHLLAPRILEIGCGTGLLTRLIAARFAPTEMILNDLCPEMAVCFANLPRTVFVAGDAQKADLPSGVDVIVSSSAVQWFDDLRAFVEQCAARLPKGGCIAISSFGAQTLQEVRALTGQGLNYLSFDAFVSAFSAAFEPLETEAFTHTLRFDTPGDVLRHLKETGVTATAVTDRAVWTRQRLAAFSEAYQTRFTDAGQGVRLTYEPYLFVGARR